MGLNPAHTIYRPTGSAGVQETIPADWENVPNSEILVGKPPLQSRIVDGIDIDFSYLSNLFEAGVRKYWSRDSSRKIGDHITIDKDIYKVTVITEITKKEPPYSTDDIPLIFNTNREWGRSGNPGGKYGALSGSTRAIDKLIVNQIQQVTYNVGYIKFRKWEYSSKKDEDDDFMHTAAHELGHEILQAFGGDIFSYQHKGTSYLTQDTKPVSPPERKWYEYVLPIVGTVNDARDQMKNIPGEDYPNSPDEQDLMKYYNKGNFSYPRNVAAEDDVKGLIWLIKLELE